MRRRTSVSILTAMLLPRLAAADSAKVPINGLLKSGSGSGSGTASGLVAKRQ